MTEKFPNVEDVVFDYLLESGVYTQTEELSDDFLKNVFTIFPSKIKKLEEGLSKQKLHYSFVEFKNKEEKKFWESFLRKLEEYVELVNQVGKYEN